MILIKKKPYTLIQGDCLEELKSIKTGSVDLILTDPPYQVLVAKEKPVKKYEKLLSVNWDKKINTELLFKECDRVLRVNGCLILFSQEPYTSELVLQTNKNLLFAYRCTWLKNSFGNALITKVSPAKYVEDICVFFKRYDNNITHPLRDYAKKIHKYINYNRAAVKSRLGHSGAQFFLESSDSATIFKLCSFKTYNDLIKYYLIDTQHWFIKYDGLLKFDTKYSRVFNIPPGFNHVSDVFEYPKDSDEFHPTQKPVALLKKLIQIYTNKGDLVLDFTAGSFSTAIACLRCGRRFIGIERNKHYFSLGKARIIKENHRKT